MEYRFDVFLFGLILTILIIGSVVLSFPPRILREARKNCYRSDGSKSSFRTKREIRHFLDFLGSIALVLVLINAVTIGSIALVHYTVVPIPIVAEILGAFDADPVEWEAAIETGQLGDVGEKYEQWASRSGLSDDQTRFWQEFLWKNWLVVAAIILTLIVLYYWLVSRFYVRSLTQYHREIHRRRQRYRIRDTLRRTKRSEPRA